MDHPAKTLIGESVAFYPPNFPDSPHAAQVTRVHSDHVADVVYYCTHDHAWKEFTSATFGKKAGGGCYVNPF